MDKTEFLYPRARYRGDVKPENLVFNANLQEFAQRVTYLSCLETSGKISALDAYEQIHQLWDQLRHSKHELGIH
ncbi:MAG: hypothetical protein AAGA75_22220 [Cyanobacteria bacterium P01_E01_bin.6]